MKRKIPCGKNISIGWKCCEGHLCDRCKLYLNKQKVFEDIERIGEKNNPENASICDDEGYECMLISYKQLGELREKHWR